MKILVTGFEPFNDEKINPSYEIVKLLPESFDGNEIIKLKLPVEFYNASNILKEAIYKFSPDIILCLGQAGGRDKVTIEKIAINYKNASINDNIGQCPKDLLIKEDGADGYFSNFPILEIIDTLKLNNIPSAVSYSAGTYVCNELMYNLLYLINNENKNIKGGFVHLPYLKEQIEGKSEDTPYISMDTMYNAVLLIIEVLLR